MYEVTTQQLMIFVILGFCSGVFVSFYLTRFFEVIHMWRLFQEMLIRLLLMCVSITEDIAFIKELKRKQMHEADFTPQQIRKFEEVDERTLTNWKESVILSLINKAPKSFRAAIPFTTWDEAVRFLNGALHDLKDKKDVI